MKLRRAFFGLVVVVGFIVLVLGVAGVFSPKKPPSPPPVSEQAVAEAPMTYVIKSFQSEGENWKLQAAEARLEEGRDTQLIEPVLEVRRPSAGGEERLTARADAGTTGKDPQQRVRMSGHVRIEYAGEQKAILTTNSLEAEPDAGVGRTRDEVQLVVDTQEGRQTLWGKGAEFALKQRLVTISENVRMELAGRESGVFGTTSASGGQAAAKGAKSAALSVTKVACRGPCTADGFKRTVELKNDVFLQQDGNELSAQRFEAQFSEGSQKPQRITAEGGVAFKVANAEGRCDRLIRSTLDDQLLLEGAPASVRQGTTEIAAGRIELDVGKNAILVPAAGRLNLARQGQGPADQPAEVKWSRMLRFDAAGHQALFHGDVRFSQGERTIECQSLTVKFDLENRDIREFRAETDVRLKGSMENASAGALKKGEPQPAPITAQSRELTYNLKTDSIVLAGGAMVQQSGQVVRGERIEFRPSDSAIKVTGAGSLEDRPPPGEAREPFGVSWTGEMQFDRSAQSAAFERDVALKYGAQTLRADRLQVRLDKDNKPQGFDGSGGVVIEETFAAGKGGRTLKADKVAAKVGENNKLQDLDAVGHAVLEEKGGPGGGSRILRADRIVSKMEADNPPYGGQVLEASGRVVIEESGGAAQGGRTIRAEKAVARVGQGDKLDRFDAIGRRVTVEEEGRTGSGSHLAWNVRQESGVLLGSPAELRSGGNRLFGDKIEFSQKGATVKVTSSRRVEASVAGETPWKDALRR